VAFLVVSHSASPVARFRKVMVCPAYNIMEVFEGGSETQPGK